MSLTGCDYAWAAPSPAALKAAGVTFVCRYVSWDLTKLHAPEAAHPRGSTPGRSRFAFTAAAGAPRSTSRSEVAGLLAAGISVVLVWEYGAADMRRGYTGGRSDATEAARQAAALGLPGAVICFACDYDAPESDQPLINAYLDGCAAVIGRAHVGMYAGFWPLSRARAAAKAMYWWGTFAWSGDNWDTCGWRPHIMQDGMVTIAGVSCDIDHAFAADYGQSPRPQPPAPPPPVPLELEEPPMLEIPTPGGGLSRYVLTADGTARQCQWRADGSYATTHTLPGLWQALLEAGWRDADGDGAPEQAYLQGLGRDSAAWETTWAPGDTGWQPVTRLG